MRVSAGERVCQRAGRGSQGAEAALLRPCEVPTRHVARAQVDQAIARARYRLKEGQDALDMPDMSNCVIA